MKHIYAVASSEMLERYQAISRSFLPRIQRFLIFLQEEYSVHSLPRCVVWTDNETATHLISDIPLPAFTNNYRTVFCPEIDVWRELYQYQLDGCDHPEIQRYYQRDLTENHVLQILGHEFVHHSDLFLDEAYELSRWFEEGMCEYISRRFFLSDEEFARAEQIQKVLVSRWEERCGIPPLESFDALTYKNTVSSILYEYWRSFLTVKALIDKEKGNVMAVFEKYHAWQKNGGSVSLQEWLCV